MEFVYFAEESMDFGLFQIRKFSIEELNTILRNEINKVFYPWAYIDELYKLANYWFICVTVPQYELILSHSIKIKPGAEVEIIEPIEINYTKYPKPLESILKYLTLFRWEQIARAGEFNFNIPLILQIKESLLSSPNNAPELLFLETEIVEDPNTHKEFEVPVQFNALTKINKYNILYKIKIVIQYIGGIYAK